MKSLSLLVIALSAGTLSAQSASFNPDARIQFFAEFCRPRSTVVAQAPSSIGDQADRQKGVGVRFMGEVAAAPGFYYEIGGKLDSASYLRTNTPTMNLRDIKITDSYWSLGAGYLYQPVENFALGLHLEGRGEALSAQGEVFQDLGAGLVSVGQVDATTTYLRPWVRVSADVTIPMGKLRPYIGVDAAYAITKSSQYRATSLVSMDNRTLKAMAPSAAVAVYLGARF